MGKCGYVYQAANFRYIGSFPTSVYRCTATGEKIHPRSARLLLEENAALDGVERRFWLTHGYCEYKGIEKINGLMFRYLYPLNRKAERILNAYPEYRGLPNPKDKDLRFTMRTAPGYIPQSRRRYLTVMYASSTHRNVEAGFFCSGKGGMTYGKEIKKKSQAKTAAAGYLHLGPTWPEA